MQFRPMSSTAGELREHYSIVIVGSGYGGAIVAARLAEQRKLPDGICLLERGIEQVPGDYPDRLRQAVRQVQVSTDQWRIGSKSAMFDFRFGSDVNVLVGCGLGGGSLINAGVSLRAPDAVFESGWPAGIDRGVLDPYYKMAKDTLGAADFPDVDTLAKFNALDRSAIALGARSKPAPINVTTGPAGRCRTGTGGLSQPPCTSCGNCVSGCNVGAKNTLLMNYLPIAYGHGVEILTRCTVRAVQKGRGKLEGKWLVYVDRSGISRRRPANFVVADIVVLAAGTLGSSEILMRSRRLGLELSDTLGHRFSANGDVLGFAFDGRSPVDAIAGGIGGIRHSTVGPTITGMAKVEWKDAGGSSKRILLEEGAIPSAIAPIVPFVLATSAIRRRRWKLLKALAGPYSGPLRRTLPYLLIYPDDDGGRMVLRGDRLAVEWRGHMDRPAYRAHKDLLRRAAKRGLEATLYRQPGVDGVVSPLTTVHPLGGCVMAEEADHGVVDDQCRVFSGAAGRSVHEGLFVCDGSVVPTALGVNPLLTISALAERTAKRLAETL